MRFSIFEIFDSLQPAKSPASNKTIKIKDAKNVTRDTEPKGAFDHLFVRIKQNVTVGSYSDILRERL